ncbi:MAG TPA: zf-HC2 domain-containing protein [Nitrospinaceae bacterium]|nr:zf-HC2 domain-containing protein [Nitrospinaceae bacterium]
MICCKECIDLLYDYFEGSLDQDTTQSLDEHFQECPPCVAFLNTYKVTTVLCRDTLNQIEIPDEVRHTLKNFLKEHKNE